MMSRRQWLGGSLLAAYWLATSLGHLAFSKLLVGTWQWPIVGAVRLADHIATSAFVLAVAGIAWQARRAWQSSDRLPTLAAWSAWLLLAAAMDRWLIFSVPEYFHYPQYALLAWLMAWLADPSRQRILIGPVILATTLLGMADEALQYTYVTISYSTYLDFNDFLLNLLGAMAGALLYYGFHSWRGANDGTSRDPARFGVVGFAMLMLILLSATAVLALISDPNGPMALIEREPGHYGHWLDAPHHGRYWVLPPWLGSLLIGIGGTGFSLLRGLHSRTRRVATPFFGSYSRTPCGRRQPADE